MADKDEKKPEEKTDKKAEKKEADPNEKEAKESKLVLFAAIGGVLLAALGIGGFFVIKLLSAKKNVELSAQELDSKNAHNDKKDDGHGKDTKKEEKKDDGHGKDAKKEEKKDDGHGKDAKKEDKKDDPHKQDANKKEEPKGTANFGDTFSIPKLDLNLSNALENRFIRIGVSIEYRGGENQGAELKKREVQIRDIIISSVTSKTRLELITESGKDKLRREILNRINEVTDKPVQNVYFTDFFVE